MIYLIASRSPPGLDALQMYRLTRCCFCWCRVFVGHCCNHCLILFCKPFFQILHHFGPHFYHFESLLKSLWPPWGHFWKLGLHFLNKKTDWGAKGATGGAKVESPRINSPIWTPFGNHFLDFSCFLEQIHVFLNCVFKALFFCHVSGAIWSRWKP